MKEEWRIVKDQFTIEDIGAPLLANLAKGIYTPEAMLREYVQNAGDAYFDLEEKLNKSLSTDEKTIDIYYPEDGTIAVQDSGIGMDLEDVKRFKRIALSSKLGKDRAGFRGIGIWAGFSACDTLEVETTKAGDSNKYRLTLEFAEMRKSVSENINIKELLDKRFAIQVTSGDKAEHYTQVKLVGLNEEFADLLRPEELERIASEILPCRFNPKFKHAEAITKRLRQIDGYQEFSIRVSDTEVFKAYGGNPEEPEFEILKREDEEYAFVWYCKSPTMRSLSGASNFRLRVKNIAVGGPGMYSTEQGAHWGLTGAAATLASGELLDWYMGEIHITTPDIKPNTPRSELELDSASRKAITLIRTFYGDRIAFRRASSNVNSHKTQVYDMTQQIEAGGTFQPDDAARRLKTLKKYEQLSKSRSQAKDATTQDKVQKYERRLLKELETKEPELSSKRRAVITALEGVAKTSSAGNAKKKTNGTGKSRDNSSKAKNAEREGAETTKSSQTGILPDFEQILAEVTQLIEKRLKDQDDLATDLAEAIEEIFKEHGLLVTA